MKCWILNSAVIAAGAYGQYDYAPATAAEARAYLRAPGWLSRVGYPEAAAYLRALAAPGVEIPLSREVSAMEPGDIALVARLRYRVEPTHKGRHVPEPASYELAWLRRIS